MATGFDVGLADGVSSFDARRWKAGAGGGEMAPRRVTSFKKLECRVAHINGGRSSHDVEQGEAGVWIQTAENAKKKRLLYRISSGVRDRYAGE